MFRDAVHSHNEGSLLALFELNTPDDTSNQSMSCDRKNKISGCHVMCPCWPQQQILSYYSANLVDTVFKFQKRWNGCKLQTSVDFIIKVGFEKCKI
jgi:hypothetical protein